MILLNRVLSGPDEALANRVRAVLGLPQPGHAPVDEAKQAGPKDMAELSIQAGYVKDALVYLGQAHAADPGDYGVVLKLGWACNILHRDSEAFHWFGLARRSDDSKISEAATQAWHNLRPAEQLFQVSGWIFPLVSTRWNDLFGYGQFKVELHTRFRLRPYVSVRLDGDSRSNTSALLFSETSVIFAAGVRTLPWHGISGWLEAGTGVNYLKGNMLPDYRGGVSVKRFIGKALGGESAGRFAETTADGEFLSRFGSDFLVYSQSRAGYMIGPKSLHTQLYWGMNLTFDTARQAWANFVETGPGARFRTSRMPASMYLVCSAVRGGYLIHDGDPNRRAYNDFRAGIWYAFVH